MERQPEQEALTSRKQGVARAQRTVRFAENTAADPMQRIAAWADQRQANHARYVTEVEQARQEALARTDAFLDEIDELFSKPASWQQHLADDDSSEEGNGGLADQPVSEETSTSERPSSALDVDFTVDVSTVKSTSGDTTVDMGP